jgi:heat shock protein HtpX
MNAIKTTLFLTVLTCMFLITGYWLNGTTGAMLALALAGLTNIGMYWFSHKIVLKMQRAKPLDTKKYGYIERIVKDLARRDNLPMPSLYFVDTPIPNAFATGRSPRHGIVAVTRGITELLNEQELTAVLAHELGHIKNRDMLVSALAATAAGAIAFVADLAFWGGALFGGNDEEGGNWAGELALLILAPMAAMLIQLAVSRTREFGADHHAKELLGDGKDLASALMKLESVKPALSRFRPSPKDQATAHLMFQNMFNMGGLSSLFSTHPKTEDRVKRLI